MIAGWSIRLSLSSVAARCGTLTVPEDPEAAAGAPNRAVRRGGSRAQSARPTPPLVPAGGRSRAGGRGSLRELRGRLCPRQPQSRHRARGPARHRQVRPLVCNYPEDWQRHRRFAPELRRATSDCLAKIRRSRALLHHERRGPGSGSGPRGARILRDRSYGSSYGTRVAELYMRRHPARDPCRRAGRRHLPGTGHRPRYPARWRARARAHRLPLRSRRPTALPRTRTWRPSSASCAAASAGRSCP